jgi:hypothetical protein
MTEETDDREQIRALVQGASPDAQTILNEVLQLEKAKLHMKMPSGIADDIVSRVKALIK